MLAGTSVPISCLSMEGRSNAFAALVLFHYVVGQLLRFSDAVNGSAHSLHSGGHR